MAGPSLVWTLREQGFDFRVQAALLGVNESTVRRWEEANSIPTHERVILSTFVVALERKPELAQRIPDILVSRGVVVALHMLLDAALSTADST